MLETEGKTPLPVTAIQVWRIQKKQKKTKPFTNSIFFYFTPFYTCLTLDFGLPGRNSLPSPESPQNRRAKALWDVVINPPEACWIPENRWSTAPKSLNKQPNVQRNGTRKWEEKWWGAGLSKSLYIFSKHSLRFLLSFKAPEKQDWLSAVLVGGFSRNFSYHGSSSPRNILVHHMSVTFLCPLSGHVGNTPWQPIPWNKN